MYLTYDEYCAFGGTLEDPAFAQFEFEAEAIVDYVTFNRLVNEEEIPDKVKQLIFYIIGIAQKKGDSMSLGGIVGMTPSSGGRYVTSQSNDGVSISYNGMPAAELYALCDKDIQASINTYLHGIRNSLGRKLLYRGLYPGE